MLKVDKWHLKAKVKIHPIKCLTWSFFFFFLLKYTLQTVTHRLRKLEQAI